MIQDLIKEGGKYAGYIPIIQGGNAGPHQDAAYLNGVWMCASRKVLSEAEIWENAKIVWNNLPNHQVASGYIQAHRIVDKVIKAAGDNNFLGAGGDGIHTGIKKEIRADSRWWTR